MTESVSGPHSSAFGKIVGEGDFISVGTSSREAAGVQQWLFRAYDQAGGRTPDGLTCFLMRPPTGTGWITGVMAPSSDRVGREFPLCVCTELGVELSSIDYPFLPHALGEHLAHAGSLCLSEWSSLSDLASALGTLAPPHPGAVLPARYDCTHSCQLIAIEEWWTRVLGASDLHARAYALYSVSEACRTGGSGREDEATVVLECAATTAFDLFLWLRIVQLCGGPAARLPDVAWRPNEGRIWISMGGMPGDLLGHVVGDTRGAMKYWPTVTSDADARLVAESELPVPLQAAQRACGPVAQFLETIGTA